LSIPVAAKCALGPEKQSALLWQEETQGEKRGHGAPGTLVGTGENSGHDSCYRVAYALLQSRKCQHQSEPSSQRPHAYTFPSPVHPVRMAPNILPQVPFRLLMNKIRYGLISRLARSWSELVRSPWKLTIFTCHGLVATAPAGGSLLRIHSRERV
jgi:hypothetical protein